VLSISTKIVVLDLKKGIYIMIISAVFSFLHFAAVFSLFATLLFVLVTISYKPTCIEAQRIQMCDKWYGISALLVFVVGQLRVFYFEKGSEFYLHNPFYHAKLGLFFLVAVLSIYPSVRFYKWRTETRHGLPPAVTETQIKWIVVILKLEMLLLLGVALSASFMARGIRF
jgi:putative membrane protein